MMPSKGRYTPRPYSNAAMVLEFIRRSGEEGMTAMECDAMLRYWRYFPFSQTTVAILAGLKRRGVVSEEGGRFRLIP